MATANDKGDIALWDLNKSQLLHVMAAAHDGSVSSIQFLTGKPLLFSSGSDNALKVNIMMFLF